VIESVAAGFLARPSPPAARCSGSSAPVIIHVHSTRPPRDRFFKYARPFRQKCVPFQICTVPIIRSANLISRPIAHDAALNHAHMLSKLAVDGPAEPRRFRGAAVQCTKCHRHCISRNRLQDSLRFSAGAGRALCCSIAQRFRPAGVVLYPPDGQKPLFRQPHNGGLECHRRVVLDLCASD